MEGPQRCGPGGGNSGDRGRGRGGGCSREAPGARASKEEREQSRPSAPAFEKDEMGKRVAASAAAVTAEAAAQTAAAARNRRFQRGQLVELHGLTGAPQHNGKRGVVCSFMPDRDRYKVKLCVDKADHGALSDGRSKSLGVKEFNLSPAMVEAGDASAVRADQAKHLLSKTELLELQQQVLYHDEFLLRRVLSCLSLYDAAHCGALLCCKIWRQNMLELFIPQLSAPGRDVRVIGVKSAPPHLPDGPGAAMSTGSYVNGKSGHIVHPDREWETGNERDGFVIVQVMKTQTKFTTMGRGRAAGFTSCIWPQNLGVPTQSCLPEVARQLRAKAMATIAVPALALSIIDFEGNSASNCPLKCCRCALRFPHVMDGFPDGTPMCVLTHTGWSLSDFPKVHCVDCVIREAALPDVAKDLFVGRRLLASSFLRRHYTSRKSFLDTMCHPQSRLTDIQRRTLLSAFPSEPTPQGALLSFSRSHSHARITLSADGCEATKTGDDHLCTAASRTVMQSGQHFVQFTILEYSGGSMLFGMVRPGWDAAGGKDVEDVADHCFIDAYDLHSYPGNIRWREGIGGGGAGQGSRIGLLLDLEEGSLTAYQNSEAVPSQHSHLIAARDGELLGSSWELLGVVRTGLTGEYCWAVCLSWGDGDRVRIDSRPSEMVEDGRVGVAKIIPEPALPPAAQALLD